MCGGNELEGRAELCTLGTLQQPPCPTVTPCSLLTLPTPVLLPMCFLAFWNRDGLHPHSHCHSSKWNSTKGTCRSCFNTNISFLLSVALSRSAKPHLVDLCSPESLLRIRCPYQFKLIRHPCPLKKNHPAIAALWHFGQNAGGESNFHHYLRHDTDA